MFGQHANTFEKRISCKNIIEEWNFFFEIKNSKWTSISLHIVLSIMPFELPVTRNNIDTNSTENDSENGTPACESSEDSIDLSGEPSSQKR